MCVCVCVCVMSCITMGSSTHTLPASVGRGEQSGPLIGRVMLTDGRELPSNLEPPLRVWARSGPPSALELVHTLLVSSA